MASAEATAEEPKKADENVAAAENANAAEGSSIIGSVMAMASAGLAKAQEIDSQYKISEQAMVTAAAGVQKAKEIDEQYKVTEQAKAAVGAAVGKAKELDAKYQITEKAAKVAETSAAAVTAADQKLGVSKKVAAGAEIIKQKDEADFVPISVTAKSRTLTFKDQSVVIPDDFEAKAEGEKVSMGNFTLTFATSEEAVQFVTFLTSANKEEEVQGLSSGVQTE